MSKGFASVALLRLAAALGVAAAAGLAGCGPDNVAACETYVDRLNEARAQCYLDRVEKETMCPASLNHGADCTDHYELLADSVKCEDPNEGTITFGDTPPPDPTGAPPQADYLAGPGCF